MRVTRRKDGRVETSFGPLKACQFEFEPRLERRSKRRRERIPVELARTLYDELRNWRLVAERLPRSGNGQKFQPKSIFAAVRWADRGNAGCQIGG
jgi:hypothetical protein